MGRSALIYLFRHGAVVGAETRRFIGHLDVPLSEAGEAVVVRQAERLARTPLEAIYASDLSRAARTAELLAAPHGLRPVLLPELREMAMGRWEGLRADEISAREPDEYQRWMTAVGDYRFPEGESFPDVLARAWPALETIVGRHTAGAVAVVGHGGTNRALLCRALGVPLGRALALGQDYAALTVLELGRHGARLERLNEAPARSPS